MIIGSRARSRDCRKTRKLFHVLGAVGYRVMMKAFLLFILICLPLSSCVELYEVYDLVKYNCTRKTTHPDLACIGGVFPSQPHETDLSSVSGAGCWEDSRCNFGLLVLRQNEGSGSKVFYILFATRDVASKRIIMRVSLSKYVSNLRWTFRTPYMSNDYFTKLCASELGQLTRSSEVDDQPLRKYQCNYLEQDLQETNIAAGVFGPTSEKVHFFGRKLLVPSLDISKDAVHVIIKMSYWIPDKHELDYYGDDVLLLQPRGTGDISVQDDSGANDSKGLPGWAIAVIMIGVLAVVGGFLWFILKEEKNRPTAVFYGDILNTEGRVDLRI